MKSYKKLFALFVIVTGVCITYTVLAHDAWVEPGKGPLFHVFFGDKAPEAYDAANVTSLKVIGAQKQALTYKRMKTKDGLDIKVDGKPALFTLEYDNGYWVRSDTVSSRIQRSQITAETNALHATKYSKTMLYWESWMAKPQGQRVEFVPVAISQLPKAGAELRLQMLLDGKPVAGQMVENNSSEEGPKTDARGYVTVTVVRGTNRFASDYRAAQPDGTGAKRISLTAVLVFAAE